MAKEPEFEAIASRKKKIDQQKLISIHLRCLLGLKRVNDVMRKLFFLSDKYVKFLNVAIYSSFRNWAYLNLAVANFTPLFWWTHRCFNLIYLVKHNWLGFAQHFGTQTKQSILFLCSFNMFGSKLTWLSWFARILSISLNCWELYGFIHGGFFLAIWNGCHCLWRHISTFPSCLESWNLLVVSHPSIS